MGLGAVPLRLELLRLRLVWELSHGLRRHNWRQAGLPPNRDLGSHDLSEQLSPTVLPCSSSSRCREGMSSLHKIYSCASRDLHKVLPLSLSISLSLSVRHIQYRENKKACARPSWAERCVLRTLMCNTIESSHEYQMLICSFAKFLLRLQRMLFKQPHGIWTKKKHPHFIIFYIVISSIWLKTLNAYTSHRLYN